MNRREFATTVAGLIATARSSQSATVRRYALRPFTKADASVLLEMEVGPRLPERLALVETDSGNLVGPDIRARDLPALFELRTYRAPVELSGHGIEPWLVGERSFLLPFESLSHREQFWREVTAQRTWPAYEFAIYRPRDGFGPRRRYTS